MGLPRRVSNKLVKAARTVSKTQCQIKLLKDVLSNNTLMSSKIISSIEPNIGKKFGFRDLQSEADSILDKCREQLLELSVKDAERSFTNKKNDLVCLKKNIITDPNVNVLEVDQTINHVKSKTTFLQSKKHNKKIDFHLKRDHKLPSEKYLKPKYVKRKEHNLKTIQRKTIDRNNYRKSVKKRKSESLSKISEKIKQSNIVVNLSDKEIPDLAYIYLAYGLNFVEAKILNKGDLKLDLQEFLRKLSWKAYFHINPDARPPHDEEDLHSDLKVKSRKYPTLTNPLLDEVKSKVLGWVSNFKPKHPIKNLSPQAIRGRRWILNAVKNKELFVTKADKWGAIIILNYSTVTKTLEEELFDTTKYEVVSTDPDSHREDINKLVKRKVIDLESRSLIMAKDRELITGLNDNLHQKHNPEYRPEDPKIYPLFKLHKLTNDQIQGKLTPPARFVNNSKYGPLYRVEKWISPFMTNISRSYCSDEFLLDTDHLLSQIKDYNEHLATIPKNKRSKISLATLDVKALYPSIRPTEAMSALETAFAEDNTTAAHTKTAILEISQIILDQAYVRYKGKCFRSVVGIATGGCNSRQTADCVLHRLIDSVKDKIPLWKLIKFLKRFIDDIFLMWGGTKRQFQQLVDNLNKLTSEFDITFGEYSIGNSVNFLDVTLTIDKDGFINYTLYRKPTDSRLYLKVGSFHPKHVFSSVAFSQMLRVWKRNSTIQGANKDIEDLKNDLEKCGDNRDTLEQLHQKLISKISQRTCIFDPVKKTDNVLVDVVDYFEEIQELKSLLNDLKSDICRLIGNNAKVLVSARKGRSIGSSVVQNRQLCEVPIDPMTSQRCGTKKCKSCTLLCDMGDSLII